MAGWLAWSVSPLPWPVVAFGRLTVSLLPQSVPGIVKEVPKDADDQDVYCTYVGEGANITVAVTQTRDGVRYFHGAGQGPGVEPVVRHAASAACSATCRR